MNESNINRGNTDAYYEQIARRMSRLSFWELVDAIDIIEQYMKNKSFKNNFTCYKLDNYEEANKKTGYIIWGMGDDGRGSIRLLRCLNKRIILCADMQRKGETVLGCKVVSPEEILRLYDNEVIIVASRKYQHEIMDQIIRQYPDLKDAIFDFRFADAKRKRADEYRKKAVLSYPPLWITIGITSACSYRCLFCSYHGDDAKGKSNTYGLPFKLSYQDFKRIVDMAKAGGVPEIHICGTGEPFLNSDILRMIDYVIEQYGEVSLQTDFWKTLFEKKNYLRELIKREKHITYISTDVISSLEEEHNAIKKGASYRELLETMEYIGRNSNLKIRVVIILTKKNYKHIKEIIDDFIERNVNFDILVVNLFSYDYSEFTSSDNVYVSEDNGITKALQEADIYAKQKGISIIVPEPEDVPVHECGVFWDEFQTWPVKGCKEGRYGENMIPHACAAVVRGGVKSVGYVFDYGTIMDAWNNDILVKIRQDMMNGKYPDEWCRKCYMYQGPNSIFTK